MDKNEKDMSELIQVLKPTSLGKPKADTSLIVAKAAHGAGMFRVEAGEVKVPRKRTSVDDTKFAWMGELAEPTTRYYFIASPTEAIEVEWNEDLGLFEGPEGKDGKRAQYTGDNVAEMAEPDSRDVTGTPDGLAQLNAAVNRFNAKTGKRLVTRFVAAKRDNSGRTLEQTTRVIRVR